MGSLVTNCFVHHVKDPFRVEVKDVYKGRLVNEFVFAKEKLKSERSLGVRLTQARLPCVVLKHALATGVIATEIGAVESIVKFVRMWMTEKTVTALELCVCKEALMKSLPEDERMAEELPYPYNLVRICVPVDS